MTYEAFVLTPESRTHLLDNIEPKYTEVIAHHVTHRFGVPENPEGGYGKIVSITVVGYAEEDGLEALVVHVNGEAKRPDGKRYHITLSLDREKGKKPQMSNQLIAAGFTQLNQPFSISAKFAYI